jgi:hypothetical protein
MFLRKGFFSVFGHSFILRVTFQDFLNYFYRTIVIMGKLVGFRSTFSLPPLSPHNGAGKMCGHRESEYLGFEGLVTCPRILSRSLLMVNDVFCWYAALSNLGIETCRLYVDTFHSFLLLKTCLNPNIKGKSVYCWYKCQSPSRFSVLLRSICDAGKTETEF